MDQGALHAVCHVVENLDTLYRREPQSAGKCGDVRGRAGKSPQAAADGSHGTAFAGPRADVVRIGDRQNRNRHLDDREMRAAGAAVNPSGRTASGQGDRAGLGPLGGGSASPSR